MSEDVKPIKKLNDQGCGDLDLGLTILGDAESVSIRIYDQDAGIEFLEINLNPADFLALTMGRNAQRPVVGNFRSIHRVGKKMEIDHVTFPMPENTAYKDRSVVAYERAKHFCPSSWIPDKYFGSQRSFFMKQVPSEGSTGQISGGPSYAWARATIRRWVEKE